MKRLSIVASVFAVVALGCFFSGSLWARPMTLMQKAYHTSPVPSLSMLIKNNAPALGLDAEQMSVVRGWMQQNRKTNRALMAEIFQLEQTIADGVLKGMSVDELQAQKAALFEARSGLFDLKAQCVALMKNTLDEAQWQKVMAMRDKAQRAAESSFGGNEVQSFLRVAPMPKFMLIVLMHHAELKLTATQNEALEAWRFEHMNRWATLFDEVLTAEKALTGDAMALADRADLLARYDTLLAKRREMAGMSLACRDNMQKVLSDKQWAFVVEKFDSYR